MPEMIDVQRDDVNDLKKMKDIRNEICTVICHVITDVLFQKIKESLTHLNDWNQTISCPISKYSNKYIC